MNLSRNEHMYTAEQLEKMKTILADYNHFCGYAHHEGQAKEETHFFTYTAEQSAKYENAQGSFWTMNNGYKKLNEKTL